MATNSKGHVFVITRSGETRVFEFDRNGAFVKEFGKGSYGYGFAHAVRVDKDDNVWSVDEGSNLILKYAPDGRLLMVLGKRPDADRSAEPHAGHGAVFGREPPYSFHRPTDVTWDPQGNIFVSDGYTDSRIVKYDKNGRFIKSMGTRGNGVNQFSTPHGITADAQGNIYVADRGNSRIVVLDNDLELEDDLRGCRRAVGHLHFAEHAAVSLQHGSSRHQHGGRQRGDHRRDLQTAAGWQGARPVRQGGQGAE